MAKRFMNHWPSILLVIALVIGIVTCFGRLNNLVIDEVRALISVLFGIATTCLLLSYIWLTQRKPLNRSWPNEIFPIGVDIMPSMHPRGRLGSSDSVLDSQLTIRTISNLEMECPPTYEDALINSKVINWEQSSSVMDKRVSKSLNSSNLEICNCHRSLVKTKAQQLEQSTGVFNICCNCISPFKSYYKQDCFNENEYEAVQSNDQQSPYNSCAHQGIRSDYDVTSNSGKIFYVQLDVNQLMLSSSPPKYCEQMSQNYLNEMNYNNTK